MKELNNYILEKLNKINRSSTFTYNPDDLNNDNIILYSDLGDEDEQDSIWSQCKHKLDEINDVYDGFIAFKRKPISETDLTDDFCLKDLNTDLEDLVNEYITGNDAGYEVRLKGGHLEIDCINSGSRMTYYIYALDQEIYDFVDDWYQGEEEPKDLTFLLNEDAIKEIK